MHATAMSNGKLFFDTYVQQLGQVSVIDIGAQDVNGSLRTVCPGNATYIGVDFMEAKGVDVVLTDPYSLPFDTNSVDVVVSSSCFEHSEMFWVLFLEILRILKPEGLFYLNVPSNGAFHRYPVDCWRFYPDSGNALANWAKRSGIDAALLESYISYQTPQQDRETWNDFVAVFIKDESKASLHRSRILHQFKDFYNGIMHGGNAFLNFSESPEDQKKLKAIAAIAGNKITLR